MEKLKETTKSKPSVSLSLTKKVKTLLLMGAKAVGYDECFSYIEEQLTVPEAKAVDGFLKWVCENRDKSDHPEDYGFGSDIDARYAEYLSDK